MSSVFKNLIHSPKSKIDPVSFKLTIGFNKEDIFKNLKLQIYDSLISKKDLLETDILINDLASYIKEPTDKTVFDQLVKTWNTNKHTISSPTKWKPTITESPIDAMRKLKDLFQ